MRGGLDTARVCQRTPTAGRSSGDELSALVNAGPPFYRPPWSPTVVGMVLDDGTDWDEVAELVTESYRFCAPRTLRRRLDQ